jgi:hypothetical protein
MPVGPDARARHRDGVEDRGVVAGVADDGVAGGEEGGDAAHVGEVAGGEDEGVLGAHPLRELALELEVEGDRAVQEARAGEAGAVLLEGAAGRLHHPRVLGQAEVVVRAEHQALAALHPHHRAGGALERPVVGEEVLLARQPQLLEALVRAGLLEEVYGGGHR